VSAFPWAQLSGRALAADLSRALAALRRRRGRAS